MPFSLQKTPYGLLDLFRLRTQGANPPQFGELVTPTADVTEFYGADLSQVFNYTPGAGAITQTLTFTQPSVRRILGISGEVNIGAAAGTVLRMRLGVRPAAGNVVHWIGQSLPTPAIGVKFVVSAQAFVPYVLPAGAQVVLEVDGNAAGVDHQSAVRVFAQDLSITA